MPRPKGSKNKSNIEPELAQLQKEKENVQEFDPHPPAQKPQAPSEDINLKAAQLEKQLNEVKREQIRFKHDQTKLCHTYKLEVSKFQKNLAVQKDEEAQFIGVDHCHFFHTIDHRGNIQTTSTHTGGHYHNIIVVDPGDEKNGIAPTYRCSGPMKKIRKKNARKQWVTVEVPAEDPEIDQHTHDMNYLKSDPWSPRRVNPEFVKYSSMVAQKASAPPGAAEG